MGHCFCCDSDSSCLAGVEQESFQFYVAFTVEPQQPTNKEPSDKQETETSRVLMNVGTVLEPSNLLFFRSVCVGCLVVCASQEWV